MVFEAVSPIFPAFLFRQKPWEIFWIPESANEMQTCPLLMALKKRPDQEVFFDAQGNVWHRRIITNRSYGIFAKMLAYTFYNPKNVPIQNEWVLQGFYELNVLKARVQECVEADDDVLTQFIEAEELVAQVNLATTFDELVMVVNRAIYQGV